MDLLRSLAAPLNSAGLIFIGLSALLLAVVVRVGVWGVIPAFFLVSWLFKYGYALLEQVANGRFEAPTASVEMLGPFEARPWVQTALVVCVYAAIRAVGGPAAKGMTLAALLLLPASVAVLGTSGQAIDAFNPLALWRMLRGLGLYYLWIVAAIAVLAAVAVLAWRTPLWSAIRYALVELAVLEAFSLIGGAVYARRLPLGFEPRRSPERIQARVAAELRRQLQQLLDELFQFVNARQSERAVQHLAHWLAQCDPGHLAEDARAISATVLQWHSELGTTILLRGLIGQLADAGKLSLALEMLHAVLAQRAGFCVGSEPVAIELARHARASGQPRFALQILDRYAQQFPDSPWSEAGQQLRRELELR
jgi:hypothetical protein